MDNIIKYSASPIDDLMRDLDKKKEFAALLISSGLIPKAFDKPEKVLVCMFKAQELGVPPMEALASMPVINGKVTIQGNLILSLINRSKNCRKMVIDSHETYCEVTMSRRDYELTYSSRFTLDDAKKAGLLDKLIWKQYQRLMLQWRAVANTARVVFPDIMSGLYTPEEIASIDDSAKVTVDADGNIEVEEIKPEDKKQPAAQAQAENAKSTNPECPENLSGNPASTVFPENNFEAQTADKPTGQPKTIEQVADEFRKNSEPLTDDDFTTVKKLIQQGYSWNGKVYKNNTIYVNNKKFYLTAEEIESIVKFVNALSSEYSQAQPDDLPF